MLLCDELVIVVGNLPKMARAREPIEKGAIHRWQWEKLHKVHKGPTYKMAPGAGKDQTKFEVR